jgi:hypothetical protein
VHRPGLPTVHLGFAHAHQAEHAARSLTDDLHNTQHIPGTTITHSATPDGVVPPTPVPVDPYALADLIAQEDHDLSTGHAFPDLYSRLKAQEGYDTATRIWREACFWTGQLEDDDGDVTDSRDVDGEVADQ